jgi:hypothetical protein
MQGAATLMVQLKMRFVLSWPVIANGVHKENKFRLVAGCSGMI